MWGSSTYYLTYDAENRLTQVSGAASATFVYDGDGNRVKATFGSATTVYVGSHYEKQGSTVRKYYYAGGARVAMRQSGTLYYLLSDHLGSTAITVNSSGSEVGELRYYPYGGTRYTSGTTPTSYRFTGQREDATIGLYFYNARFYDAALGRFISADTVVPNLANPQDLNRYSYVRNSPLVYVDPSGHAMEESGVGGLTDKGWYEFYYDNPEAYYADYWAAEEGQNIPSLAMAYGYEQDVLHMSGTLDENIAPAMVERYNAEILKENSNWLVLLTCVGFVSAGDEDSIQYIENSGRAWGMSGPRGTGGGGRPGGRSDGVHQRYDDALQTARNNAGDLGGNTQSMYDPETGTLIGRQSTDGKRGWRIDDDHVNWWDWTDGKKRSGGRYGHEFFPQEQAGPHSRYPGYAPWE